MKHSRRSTWRIFPPPNRTLDKGHGRIEIRRVRTSTALNAYLDWPHVGQVFRVERHVTDLVGKNPRDEVAFGIMDLGPDEVDAARVNELVRGHWGIETRLHYVRDWTYDEDRSQVRTKQGPRVMATLRNTAIGLLRYLKLPNISGAVKHLDHHPEQIAALVIG